MQISEVYNIDNMEYMKTIPDKFFDLVIADPPYGINVAKMAYTQEENRPVKQKNGTVLRVKKLKYSHGGWDSKPPDIKYLKELKRISKNQIIWGINYMDFHLRGGRIVWNKMNGNNSFSDCEIAYCSLHERVRLFSYMWSGMFQGSTLNGTIMQGDKKLNENRIHPTQKPIQLYKWLLKNYAKQGDKIFDPNMGSQSSRIAAYDMGFDYYGCELDKDYFEQGNKRFENFKLQLKLL